MRIPVTRHGSFGNAPFVEAVVFLRRFSTSSPIKFLVDTGCSHTTICENDARRLGLDASKLKEPSMRSIGIGGNADERVIPGAVEMSLAYGSEETRRIQFDGINILIDPRKEGRDSISAGKEAFKLPSLLGRDFLSRLDCTLHFNFNHDGTWVDVSD